MEVADVLVIRYHVRAEKTWHTKRDCHDGSPMNIQRHVFCLAHKQQEPLELASFNIDYPTDSGNIQVHNY
jgi:hypothetical protein